MKKKRDRTITFYARQIRTHNVGMGSNVGSQTKHIFLLFFHGIPITKYEALFQNFLGELKDILIAYI